jgi:hypothetical protein
VIGATLHAQPSELMEMEADEIEFWLKQAEWINTRR